MPPKIKQGFESAAITVTSAYERAIKEYTRAKKDEDAETVEKELASFKKGLPPARSRQRTNCWASGCGDLTNTS